MPPTPSGQSTSKGPKRVPGGNGERGDEREGFEDIARQRAKLLLSSSNRNPDFVRTVIPVTARHPRGEPGPDSPRPFLSGGSLVVPNASTPPGLRRPAPPADLRIDVASRVEYLDLLEELVVSYAAAHGLAPDKAADLGIAARESLINAIRHGCGLDPGRRVQMELGMGEEGALV